MITHRDEGSHDNNDNIAFEDENNLSISHRPNNDDLISNLNDDLSRESHYIFVDQNNVNSFQMYTNDDLMTRDNEPLCNGNSLHIGNLPTGLHKCLQCDKAVHILFGCSIRIPGTSEGCGEPRICLDCDEKNSTIAENNATESWNRKRKLQNSRQSPSYLIRQPGFEYLDLNKKGSIVPVIL